MPTTTTDRLTRCGKLIDEIERLTLIRLDALAKAHFAEDAMRALEADMHALMRGHSPLDVLPESAEDIARERRRAAAARAFELLRDAGGPVKATEVAKGIGVDPHGLWRLLDDDPRIEKSYRSLRGTMLMWLALAPERADGTGR